MIDLCNSKKLCENKTVIVELFSSINYIFNSKEVCNHIFKKDICTKCEAKVGIADASLSMTTGSLHLYSLLLSFSYANRLWVVAKQPLNVFGEVYGLPKIKSFLKKSKDYILVDKVISVSTSLHLRGRQKVIHIYEFSNIDTTFKNKVLFCSSLKDFYSVIGEYGNTLRVTHKGIEPLYEGFFGVVKV